MPLHMAANFMQMMCSHQPPLLYINPEISITRGNSVPDDFTGIVFDIGRGEFDHHQKDSRIRKTVCRMRHLACCGRLLERIF